MKKSILLLLVFSLMSIVVFGQDTPVDENPTTTGLPSWLEAAFALLLTIIPSGFLVKANYRLGKFTALSKALTDAMSDNRVDNNEIEILRKALKELVAKQEG